MMTASSRRELYKLREIVHFLLAGAGASLRAPVTSAIMCVFCHDELHDEEFTTHGNSVGPKFEGGLTIHHKNGNHDDNRMENKQLCHTSCHKSFHRTVSNNRRAAKVVLQ